MVKVITLHENDGRWMEFLSKNPHLVFHTPQYKKFVDSAFKSHIDYWAAVVKDEIQTLLPVHRIEHSLFGAKLISTAFQEYGGPCGKPEFVKDIIDHLSSSYSYQYKYLELRFGLVGHEKVLSELMMKHEPYKRFILDLSDKETIWKNIQREKRKAVRKAEKLGVTVKPLPLSDMDKAYLLYCRNMRSFGSPPFSRGFFQSFYKNLVKKGMGKVFASYFQGQVISFLLGFCYGDRIHIIISVSDSRFLSMRPNDAMHWAFIQYAMHKEFSYFDFGRVRENSGQFEFKKKWGAELFSLPHYFLLWRCKNIPAIDPENPKYKILTQLWRRLPLNLIKLFGPKIREGLGI
jgi:FemAB-related protein (PEP-CTERM system-associated)